MLQQDDDAFALCEQILAAYNYHIYKTELLNNKMLDLHMWLFGLQLSHVLWWHAVLYLKQAFL